MVVVPECPDTDTPGSMHPALAKLHQRAVELGWRCLANTWQGYDATYAFECAKGHRMERWAGHVTYKKPVCMQCRADASRERWTATLAQRGGELVEGTFEGLKQRYRLRCARGHEWEALGRKVVAGSWCPRCRDELVARRHLKADGLERLQSIAQRRGGRCLATRYVGGSTHYAFECAERHQWSAQGAEIVRGQWCPVCALKVIGAAASAHHFCHDGLQRMQDVAREHDGTCLATEYVGSHKRYRFRCAEGHEWETKAVAVWAGKWCRECYWQSLKRTIEDMQALARGYGGECLSQAYVDMRTKLHWRCERGHEWSTTPAVIIRGHWCPECAWLARSTKRKTRRKYEAVAAPDSPPA